MNFERGLDVKETLGIGKFQEVSKILKETCDKILSGESRVLWSNVSSSQATIYQVEPAEIKYENRPDRGGGNVNKFYIYMSLNDFQNLSSVKDLFKAAKHHLGHGISEEGEIKAMNYYIGSKPIRKAGFKLWKNPLLIEIIYVKF